MTAHTPPALRIKNRWFKAGDDHARSPAEQAGAMAFITWRLAVNMVKRLRAAKFEVDAGMPYLGVVKETLVFLAAVADRIAHQRLEPEARAEFVVALVQHLARHLQENADDLLGPQPPGATSHAHAFIDLYNELVDHYAEFGEDLSAPDRDAGFAPDFAFVRYLGARLEPVVPEVDRRWVLDQIMAIEAPEAVGIVRRSMRELLDPAAASGSARGRRGVLSGD
jgi:hypothetical protein